MKHISKIVACATLALAAIPATASATMPLRNSGEISAFQARYGLAKTGVLDSTTKACAWQRDCPPLAASSAPASSGESSICHNGILSDDAGQGCSDGLYQRVYGSSSTPAPQAAAPARSYSTPSYSGGGATPPQSIAQCESGGNPHAVSGNGMYRGKWQFSYSTWRSVGGSGDPAAASEGEQDRRAAILYSRTGPSSWPVCGR